MIAINLHKSPIRRLSPHMVARNKLKFHIKPIMELQQARHPHTLTRGIPTLAVNC